MLGLLPLLHGHWEQFLCRLRKYRVIITVKSSVAFFAVLWSHLKVIWLWVWFFLVRFVIRAIKANLVQFFFPAFEVFWLFILIILIRVTFVRAFLRDDVWCQMLFCFVSSRDISWLNNWNLSLVTRPLLPHFRISNFVLYWLFISIVRLIVPLSDCLFDPRLVLLLVFQFS